MECSGYMVVNGKNQGRIDGSSFRKDRENKINLYSFTHCVSAPFQTHKNISNGSVVHKPIEILKEIDKSTPKLYQALVEKEELDIEFHWYRFNERGVEELYYKVILTHAHLTAISPFMPNPNQRSSDTLRFMETVTIAYQKIKWDWGPHGDITFETDWRNDS